MGMQLSSNRTRLHFDGVAPTITAEVTRRRADGMVVTQALPFLRLDTSVTERGRRSRIKRVAIAMDGDVPRLLLELHHDHGDAPPEDDTLESFTPGMSARPARTDSTVPYGFEPSHVASPVVLRDPPAALARPSSAPRPSWILRTLQRLLSTLMTFVTPTSV